MGRLVRRRGRSHGEISLPPHPSVPLIFSGSRAAPDPASVSLARDLIARYATLRPAIARALFEHYEPSREGGDGMPGLDGPERVWAHVSPVRVLVEPMSRLDTVEIAYRAAWDEEHTLGARFQSWELVELNGSVL